MEEPTIRDLQNRVPRSSFGLKRKEVTETSKTLLNGEVHIRVLVTQ
jgi:hypothetical protein